MSEHVAYITRIKNLRKAENSDRLQIGECFGNSVIVNMDYKDNQLGVYFPIDLQLSERFCAVNDLVRRKDENGKDCGGYMDPAKRNVKAIRLRGNKSDGLFLPLTSLADFTDINELHEGDRFDVLNGEEICRKYIPALKSGRIYPHGAGASHKAKENLFPTFKQHIETEQLAYNLDKFKPGDIVQITEKLHGTSGRTGYLPGIKYKQSWLDKLLKRKGKQYTEYDYVTGTRRVVLDGSKERKNFYESDDWRFAMADKFRGKLNKGETAYYEIVGFQGTNGASIMAEVANSKVSDKEFTKRYGETTVFKYGCNQSGGFAWDLQDTSGDIPPCCEIYVYRMTMANDDGDTVEYSPEQIAYRCEQMGINVVPQFGVFTIPETPTWITEDHGEVISAGEFALRMAELRYNGSSTLDASHIREGVVLRRLNSHKFDVYKHKNFYFKVLEGIAKDEASAPDIEEAQDVIE